MGHQRSAGVWPYGAFSVLAALFMLAGLWWIAGAGWLATGRRHPLLVAPVAAVLLVGAAAAALPLRPRWELARPVFEHVLAAQAAAPSPERLGGYQLYGVEQSEQGWIFSLNIDSTKDAAAFGYLPHGPAGLPGLAKSPDNRYVDLGGGWYLITGEG